MTEVTASSVCAAVWTVASTAASVRLGATGSVLVSTCGAAAPQPAEDQRDPLQREPDQRDPLQREPLQRDPLHREPVHVELLQREPDQREPLQREPDQREPDQVVSEPSASPTESIDAVAVDVLAGADPRHPAEDAVGERVTGPRDAEERAPAPHVGDRAQRRVRLRTPGVAQDVLLAVRASPSASTCTVPRAPSRVPVPVLGA